MPDSGLRLNVGDLVMLQRFPGTKWTVNYGWYTYNSAQALGWYFSAIPTKTILPAAGNDLATVSLVRQSVPGCPGEYAPPVGCPPTPPIPAPPEYPPYLPYPPQPPHHHHHHHCECDPDVNHRPPPPPPHPSIPPDVQQDISRAFITVDTIAQRDLLSGTKFLPHGKMVRVNQTPSGVKYYAWNQITQAWDEEPFGEAVGEDGTRFVTIQEVTEKFISEEKAKEVFVTTEEGDTRYYTRTESVNPKWEKI